MSKVLSGKEVAVSMESDLCSRVQACKDKGVVPTLAIVRVGAQSGDLSYERGVTKRAESIGVHIEPIVLSENASQDDLEAAIARVNDNPSIHGCLMFRPLPKHLDEVKICNMLKAEKDVDSISMESLAGVFADAKTGFAPSTAAACMKILDHYGIDVEGKRVAVVGRSLVIGKPVAMLLLARNATVTICHSKTQNLSQVMREADIVICATGRARAYGLDCFREGQTILDVGINFDDEGKLCGDVDYAEVSELVEAITPVPGGVGSVTSSTTLEHTVSAAERIVK